MHDHVQNIVAGINAPTDLDRGQREACEWAAAEVLTLADIHAPGDEIRIEERMEVKDAAGNIISWGFADFNVGTLLPDLKSGLDWRPDLHWHKPQLATYALARMQKLGVDKILCVEIYVLPNRKREYWVTRSEAEASALLRLLQMVRPHRLVPGGQRARMAHSGAVRAGKRSRRSVRQPGTDRLR
jgi:hypothetical protein